MQALTAAAVVAASMVLASVESRALHRGEGEQAASGRLRGRAVFRGTAPPQGVADMSADPACLAAGSPPPIETVAVDALGGLQNVFVYIKDGLDAARSFPMPSAPVQLNQKGCRFVPHVLGVRVGQQLAILNSDQLLHNVHATPSLNTPFNIGQPIAGMLAFRTFTQPEVMVPITDDVHSWKSAFVGVVAHPFFDVTAQSGSFALDNVPPGRYTVEAWHERFGTATRDVTLGPGKTQTLQFEFPGRGAR